MDFYCLYYIPNYADPSNDMSKLVGLDNLFRT